MNISTKQLREFTEVLLEYLEKTERSEIDVPHDYYWVIEQSDVFDPTSDPSNINLGQLSDDMIKLQSIVDGESPPIGFAFVWLSSILRAVGEKASY